MLLIPFLGQNFFPEVDAGQIKLHIRGPTGTRVEETAALVDHVEAALRQTIPAKEIASVVDNVACRCPASILTYGNSGTVGSSDADILVSLNEEHGATRDYIRTLREKLPQHFPGTTFSFLPADIVSQILNFGAPAPSTSRSWARARRITMSPINFWPPCATCRPGGRTQQQLFNQPELRVATDRSRAQQLGISQQNIATDLLLTLSGSGQIAPTFWLNYESGLQYPW